jgi:hypothetical protein
LAKRGFAWQIFSWNFFTSIDVSRRHRPPPPPPSPLYFCKGPNFNSI